MATLQQLIAKKFLAQLSNSKEIDAEKVGHLKALFAEPKKIKADDLVKIFTLPAGGDLS